MKIGERVTYITIGKVEHGIVKSISDADHVFVVYHCDGKWDQYQEYTAARTRIRDLVLGWVDGSPR